MDFKIKARAIAHMFTPRCRGGEPIGRDRNRYHSHTCDSLTEVISKALKEAYDQGAKSEAAVNELTRIDQELGIE